MARGLIWIEPDWNVKVGYMVDEWENASIWIEPDWNVKIDYTDADNTYEYLIWIEPDWNVKMHFFIVILIAYIFE